MLRLFTGIVLPPEHCLSLSMLCSGLNGAKWVDPGNFHVTIRFIGEVYDGAAEDVAAALDGIKAASFPLSIVGMGVFGSAGKPRSLYAGVEKSEPLQYLHDRVDAALRRQGLPPDDRRFTPHVTLARFQRGRAEEIEHFAAVNNLLRLAPFTVDRFRLLASYLTKAGSIYENVEEYLLR